MPSRLLEPRSSFTEMWLQKPLLDSSSCGWRGPGPSLCGPTSISFVCTRTKHSSLIEDYNCKRACKCTRAYTRRSSVFVAKVGGRRARIRPGLPRTTRLRNISDDSGDSARIAYRRASKAALTRFFCFFFFFLCFLRLRDRACVAFPSWSRFEDGLPFRCSLVLHSRVFCRSS